MTENSYRVAPPGFTLEQWEEFMKNGMLVFENALSRDEVDRYIEAIDRVCASRAWRGFALRPCREYYRDALRDLAPGR